MSPSTMYVVSILVFLHKTPLEHMLLLINKTTLTILDEIEQTCDIGKILNMKNIFI